MANHSVVAVAAKKEQTTTKHSSLTSVVSHIGLCWQSHTRKMPRTFHFVLLLKHISFRKFRIVRCRIYAAATAAVDRCERGCSFYSLLVLSCGEFNTQQIVRVWALVNVFVCVSLCVFAGTLSSKHKTKKSLLSCTHPSIQCKHPSFYS